mgnify:CR=1 FL=1
MPIKVSVVQNPPLRKRALQLAKVQGSEHWGPRLNSMTYGADALDVERAWQRAREIWQWLTNR